MFPLWLQMLLAPLDISPPIKIAIEAAYVLWKELPFFKQLWAMWHLKKAIHASVRTDSPVPLEKFTKRFGATVGEAPSLKETE